MQDNELYALVEEADSHRAAALENRKLAEAAVAELHTIVLRMDVVAKKLAQAPETVGKGIEQATRSTFEPSLKEILSSVDREVRNSVNRLDSAAIRARNSLLPWTWLLTAFLLGAAAMGAFGYYKLQVPIRDTWNAQEILYRKMNELEKQIKESEQKSSASSSRLNRSQKPKPQDSPVNPSSSVEPEAQP